MKTICGCLLAVLAIFTVGCSRSPESPTATQPPSEAAETSSASPNPLKVLVVSFEEESDYTPGIERLLRSHGVQVAVMSGQGATAAKARDFDLVLVTGNGRCGSPDPQFPDFGRPVLGFGCYGCLYFGTLHLKNGQPFT